MKFYRGLAFAILLVSAARLNAAETPIPPAPTRWVTDTANFMSPGAASSLDSRLEGYERSSGHQLIVYIAQTTGDAPIDDWAVRAFAKWKVGRKGIDDGALLLVALKDRAIRIEVGYGLEGVLNDATCKRIVAEIITPEFRRGDFRAGIEAGVEQMMRVIEGEALPPLRHGEGHGGDASNLLFFVAVVAIGAAHALRPVLGRLGAALVIGLGAAIISSFLVSSSAALLIGAAVFVLALFASPAGAWVNGRRYAWGGGFGPGSSGGVMA